MLAKKFHLKNGLFKKKLDFKLAEEERFGAELQAYDQPVSSPGPSLGGLRLAVKQRGFSE